jgi:ankyrin repeat protein
MFASLIWYVQMIESTPLHIACKKGFLELSSFLIQAGADQSLRNKVRLSLPFLSLSGAPGHVLVHCAADGTDSAAHRML